MDEVGVNMTSEASSLIQSISQEDYFYFSMRLKRCIATSIDLNIFRKKSNWDWISLLTKKIFQEKFDPLDFFLHESRIAMAAIDIPQIPIFLDIENLVFGLALVMGLFNHFAIPNCQENTDYSFMLHKGKELLEKFNQQAKLKPKDFISVISTSYQQYLGFYNFHVGYNPQNYIWIPSPMRDEKEFSYIKVKMDINPMNDLKIKVSDNIKKANSPGRFFLNGQILLKNDCLYQDDLIGNSSSDNLPNISILQKERRAFYFKTSKGF